MAIPTKYEILRDVENSSSIRIPLEKRPQAVWTLLNEEKFLQVGLIHWETAFIEDSMHDWDWHDGQFRFYGHSGAPGDKHDLVIVYFQTLSEVVPREVEESYLYSIPRNYVCGEGDYPASPIAKVMNVNVIREHTSVNTGYMMRWPGKHKNVHTWWELEDGHAVGWNENLSLGWSFPVMRLRPSLTK
jgi:hypothetical protein